MLFAFSITGSGSITRGKKTFSNTQVVRKLRIMELLHDARIYSIESVNQRKLLAVPGQSDNQAVQLQYISYMQWRGREREREGGRGREKDRMRRETLK